MGDKNQKSSELIDRAISLFKKDIKINKDISETNFSRFLGEILNLINYFIFEIIIDEHRIGKESVINDKRIKNIFVAISFTVTGVAKNLEKKFGIKVYFSNTPKAIIAIGLISCCDCSQELEKIEKFIEELTFSREDENINHEASMSFFQNFSKQY